MWCSTRATAASSMSSNKGRQPVAERGEGFGGRVEDRRDGRVHERLPVVHRAGDGEVDRVVVVLGKRLGERQATFARQPAQQAARHRLVVLSVIVAAARIASRRGGGLEHLVGVAGALQAGARVEVVGADAQAQRHERRGGLDQHIEVGGPPRARS